MPPAAVSVTAAVSRDVPLYLDEIGTCTARQYVSVIPQVTGPITQILFTDGADLHVGQPLFTIDPRPYKAALDQALAQEKQSQAALVFARAEFKRMEDLIASKAVSQEDYDTKKNAKDVAEALVEANAAAVETAKLNYQYCFVVSPINGRAGQRLVDMGNVVNANQGSLLVIQTLDPIYADFTCSETDLPSVRQHAADGTLNVMVKVPGDSGDGRKGDLTFIDTQVMTQAGMLKLRATLPNADRHFWPGQFVNVRLVLSIQKNAVLIPADAAQVGQDGSFVYIVKPDGTAEIRPVMLGQRQGDWMVVEQGLSAGENVITTGQMMVRPGGPVRVLPASGEVRASL